MSAKVLYKNLYVDGVELLQKYTDEQILQRLKALGCLPPEDHGTGPVWKTSEALLRELRVNPSAHYNKEEGMCLDFSEPFDCTARPAQGQYLFCGKPSSYTDGSFESDWGLFRRVSVEELMEDFNEG